MCACSGDDTYFQALLADPMADYQPPDTGLVRRSERPATGFLARGSTIPKILSEYRFDEAADPEAVFDETVEYASSVGWEFDPDQSGYNLTGDRFVEGTKDMGLLSPGRLMVFISSEQDDFSVTITYFEAIP
jgi:hypothetical protein